MKLQYLIYIFFMNFNGIFAIESQPTQNSNQYSYLESTSHIQQKPSIVDEDNVQIDEEIINEIRDYIVHKDKDNDNDNILPDLKKLLTDYFKSLFFGSLECLLKGESDILSHKTEFLFTKESVLIEAINSEEKNQLSSLKQYPKLSNNLLVWALKQSKLIGKIDPLSDQQIESSTKDYMNNVKLYLLAEYEEKDEKKLKLMNLSDSLALKNLLSYYKNDRIYTFPFYDMKNSGHMDSLLFATEDNYEHYSPVHTYGIYVKNIETHQYEELQKENPIKIEERIYINKGVHRSIYQIVLDENNYTAESLQNFLQENNCRFYYGEFEVELLFQKLHWGVLNNRYIKAILKDGNSYYQYQQIKYKISDEQSQNYNLWRRVDINNKNLSDKKFVALILDKNSMNKILDNLLSITSKNITDENIEMNDIERVKGLIPNTDKEFLAHLAINISKQKELIMQFQFIKYKTYLDPERNKDSRIIKLELKGDFDIKETLIISNYKLNCYLLCVLFDYYDPQGFYDQHYDFDIISSYKSLLLNILKKSITPQGQKNLLRFLEFNLHKNTKKTLEELAEFLPVKQDEKMQITNELWEKIQNLKELVSQYKNTVNSNIVNTISGENLKLFKNIYSDNFAKELETIKNDKIKTQIKIELFASLEGLLKNSENQTRIFRNFLALNFLAMLAEISGFEDSRNYFPNITDLSRFLIMNFKQEAISYEERYKTSLDVTLPF